MKSITKLEEQGVELFGGSYFPMTEGCIIFNCSDEEIVRNFIKNVIISEGKKKRILNINFV